jgi:dihydrofolate reductase
MHAEGAKVVSSLDEAIRIAESIALIDGVDEVVVIGGAQIYAEALPRADHLYITEVHADVEGDAFFPDYDETLWQESGRQDFPAEGPNPYNYSFVVYQRSNI